MRVTRVVPASRVYMPCTSVMVPMAVPVNATLTNGRGAPVLPSKTLPDTEVWATAQSPMPPQHPCQQPRGQRARRLSCLRAIQMPISYSNNTGMDTRIWLVTSGGVMTAERAKMATNACLR